MNKLVGISLVCLVLFVFTGCNNSKLKERVQVIDGVSVLMPEQFKKNDIGEGHVLIRSKIDSIDLYVTAVKDESIDTMNKEQLMEGLEINVNRFLQPMQGTLLSRKDTIMGNLVTSDFEFVMDNARPPKHGVGRFLLKGNQFISFLYVTPKQLMEKNKDLKDDFFNSIQVD
ncbi:MAG TPA: hypothetical protein VFG54_14200 [Prolixibacteraceae bacterium]|nr:hypothetical protein [Prolixibacteraceae bacterium]